VTRPQGTVDGSQVSQGAPVVVVPRLLVGTPGEVGARLVTVAGIAGLVFAILFIVAFALLRVGPPPLEPVAFRSWWEANRDRVAIGTYLLPFVGMAFIWFVAAVRHRIGRGEGLFFSTVFLGSALVFVAMLFATGAAEASVITAIENFDGGHVEGLAAFGQALAYAFFFGFTVKMSAMFMLVVASIGRSTGVLPRWLVLLSIIFGVAVLVANTVWELVALVFPVWVAMVSLILIRLARVQGGANDPAGPEPGAAQESAVP